MPVAGFRPLIVLVAIAAPLAAIVATPASAGTLDVTSCSANSAASPPTPAGGADDAWVFDTDDPAHFEGLDQCPPADDSGIDGLIAQTRLRSADVALGRFADWRFDAAPSTSITRLRRWGYIGKRLNEWELYTQTADGTKLPGSDCTVAVNDPTCVLDSAPDWTFPATSGVRVGIRCTDTTTTCAT